MDTDTGLKSTIFENIYVQGARAMLRRLLEDDLIHTKKKTDEAYAKAIVGMIEKSVENTTRYLLCDKYCLWTTGAKLVISKGFDECMRVLKQNGALIFKWNESEIKASDVLSSIRYAPLFGHTTGRQSKTIWMAFMKNE